MTVHLGRGAVIVETPTRGLCEGLRQFVHRKDGGEYEDVYTLSEDGKTLITLPGFANRVKGLCAPNSRILDERIPMPDPLLDAATVGCDVWKDAVCRAVCACGGVVSVPHIFGTAEMAAAILRAFPRERLRDRGTPLSVIAAKDGPDARRLADDLSRILPEREIDFITARRCSTSEDVIVAPYDAMGDS